MKIILFIKQKQKKQEQTKIENVEGEPSGQTGFFMILGIFVNI